jgi:hypothetical protein
MFEAITFNFINNGIAHIIASKNSSGEHIEGDSYPRIVEILFDGQP